MIVKFWHISVYLLADKNFSTDSVWRVARHQLFDQLVHKLLNKVLAWIFPLLKYITGLFQLGFDFILREIMDLVKVVVRCMVSSII